MPNLSITSITQDAGSWLLVTASDMALIPRLWTYRMTKEEIAAKSLYEGLEIQVDVNGIWTIREAK